MEISGASVSGAPRDLVLVQGVEPSLRWRTFSALIVELAEALGVGMVITVGALLADVPHTLPVAMTGFASDPALMERLGTTGRSASRYEGPTGIVGVLHSAAGDAGLPSMSLWASVPHYVAAAPCPKAALALVQRLEELVGVSVDLERAGGRGRQLRAPGGVGGVEQPGGAGVCGTPGAGCRKRWGGRRRAGERALGGRVGAALAR